MRLWLALALMFAASPARADPVTAIGSAVSWYLGAQGVTLALANIGIGLVLTGVSYGISYLVSKGGRQVEDAEAIRAGIKLPERAGLLEARRVYGTQVVAGGVFFERTIEGSGSSSPNLYVYGVAISEGEVDGLVSVIINGVECRLDAALNPLTEPWLSTGGNKIRVSFRPGSSTQDVDSLIAENWPSPPDDFYPDESERATRWGKFWQRGVATVVVELEYGADDEEHAELWGAGGLPDLKFKVRGLKVYDPNDPNQDPDDASTFTWSDNATRVQADWCRTAMGFGAASSEMGWATIKASANRDAEWLPTLSGVEKRGTINGEMGSGAANADTMAAMVLHNRAFVRRQDGLIEVVSDRAAEPVATLSQSMLVGAFSYTNEPDTRAAINRAQVRFAPASRFNESAETVYEDASLISADGQVNEASLNLPFCASPSAAQRLGFAAVTENRVARSFAGQFDISALIAAGKAGQSLDPGDVVWLDLAAPYDTINGLYEVQEIVIDPTTFNVAIQLTGTSADIVNGWSTAIETAFAA